MRSASAGLRTGPVLATVSQLVPSAVRVSIHPVALAEGESLPSPYRVMGFVDAITISFIDAGQHARDHLGDFYEVLDAISTSASTANPLLQAGAALVTSRGAAAVALPA
jgi:hypothetical protein